MNAALGAALVLVACGGGDPPAVREARVPPATPDAAIATAGPAVADAGAAPLLAEEDRAGLDLVAPVEAPVERPVRIERLAEADGDSGGFTTGEIDRVIRSHAGLVKDCYQKELEKRDLAGKIVVRIQIAADGKVASATIHQTTMNDPPVEDCIRRQMLTLRFPPKGPATVTYPFLFSKG